MKSIIKSIIILSIITLFMGCNKSHEHLKDEIPKRQAIEMITNYGTITLELYNETPLHRDNFINLVNNRAYDSLLFHRVIKNFMIQAGDPNSKNSKLTDTIGEGDAPYVVKVEIRDNLFHKKGVLAAARDDNPEKSSSAMQFYITQGKVFNDSLLNLSEKRINGSLARNYFRIKGSQKPLLDSLQNALFSGNRKLYGDLRDQLLELAKTNSDFQTYIIPEDHREAYKTIGGTPHLDQSYTVFGELIDGLNIVDSIANVDTNSMNRPLDNVMIIKARLKN